MPIEFDEAKHPRGQPDNAGQFRRKSVPAPPKATPRRRQPEVPTDDGVSSSDQASDLVRQAERLQRFAKKQGWAVDKTVMGTASGLNGKRRKLLRVLGSGGSVRLVVEHRDRLSRFGFEMVDAALAGGGGEIVVMEDGEVENDLVRDVTEVLTSMCARLYGRRSAAQRAERALEAAAA